jgi:hypothetical protein
MPSGRIALAPTDAGMRTDLRSDGSTIQSGSTNHGAQCGRSSAKLLMPTAESRFPRVGQVESATGRPAFLNGPQPPALNNKAQAADAKLAAQDAYEKDPYLKDIHKTICACSSTRSS